jgi:PKD repeat protein
MPETHFMEKPMKKTNTLLMLVACCTLAALAAPAATLYVWQNSPSPTPPHTNWAKAAHTIQEAVDAAQAGDTVLVTNGVYATGGWALDGTMTNRVTVNKALTLRSVNGPEVTMIEGAQAPGGGLGHGAVRGVYLTNGAVLCGFTLTNGATGDFASSGALLNGIDGGGVMCESLSVLTNCILIGNSAYFGGGVENGTLYNCALIGNSAVYGGGARSTTLNNCTLTGNSAFIAGGGTEGGSLFNSIVYYNQAAYDPNCSGTLLSYSCAVPKPATGEGNIADEPRLAGPWHLSAQSPCLGKGSATYASGLDLDGEPWNNPPSMGCDEHPPGTIGGNLTVSLRAAYTNVAVGCTVDFTGTIAGQVTACRWEFGDGTMVSNRPSASHAWATPGEYSAVLRAYNEAHPDGASATLTIRVVERPVHYVALQSPDPIWPYTNWSTAARSIQDAVDATGTPGAMVLVSNGVYAAGGRAVFQTMTNRVVVDKPVQVESLNGPAVTVIEGRTVGTGAGPGAVRCVYLTKGATLSGFTLTNGATLDTGDWLHFTSGGGVCGTGIGAVVTNCMLIGNTAGSYGGGAEGVTLSHCTLSNNLAPEGSGGADDCILFNCILSDNSAPGEDGEGGGVGYSTLYNCTLTRNSAFWDGGAAYLGTLYNCTATENGAGYGGGVSGATLNNCILYYNSARSDPNYANSALNYCCTTPLPGSGTANITNPPMFVDFLAGNLRLQSNSPCINAGNNAYVSGTTDLDGRPRIVGGPVDMGAYEWQGPTRYVDAASTNPVAPYSSWACAAVTIQDAVDATAPGDEVVVTNGVYATGGRWHSRVAVDKPLTLRSVNGPGLTIIRGYQLPGTTNGYGAIRCVFLSDGAVLSGFTLTNGATEDWPGDCYGGGVFCSALSSALVTNCVFVGNSAAVGGGGAAYGTFYHCLFTGNSAGGGGGAYYGTLNNCVLTGNSGGGAYNGIMVNCTITGNSGGGVASSDEGFHLCLNSIVYYNTPENYDDDIWLNWCCTTPMRTYYGWGLGLGNITNEPAFVDRAAGNFRLQSNSPCINSGELPGIIFGWLGPSIAVTDIDSYGNPRLVGGNVDMGACEFQSPSSVISYAWLQQYGLPTDGSADFADPDSDHLNNWQEWRCGTDPTNALSVLKLLPPACADGNVTLTWLSVSGRNYFLEYSTGLSANPRFLPLATDIDGQPGTTTFTDTNAVGPLPRFYRVGVSTR